MLKKMEGTNLNKLKISIILQSIKIATGLAHMAIDSLLTYLNPLLKSYLEALLESLTKLHPELLLKLNRLLLMIINMMGGTNPSSEGI